MTYTIALHFCTTLSHMTFIKSWQKSPLPQKNLEEAYFCLLLKEENTEITQKSFWNLANGLMVLRESTNHIDQITSQFSNAISLTNCPADNQINYVLLFGWFFCFCLFVLPLTWHRHGSSKPDNLVNAQRIEVDNIFKNVRVHMENRASLKNQMELNGLSSSEKNNKGKGYSCQGLKSLQKLIRWRVPLGLGTISSQKIRGQPLCFWGFRCDRCLLSLRKPFTPSNLSFFGCLPLWGKPKPLKVKDFEAQRI